MHPPEAKNTIVESPDVFVPRTASLMNTHSKTYDFISGKPEPKTEQKIKGYQQETKGTAPFSSYGICGAFHSQRLQNPRFRDHFTTTFNSDKSAFRK